MFERTSAKALVAGVLREPTVHFVLIAVALFATSAAMRARSDGRVIEIDRGRVTARIAWIEANLSDRLTAEERRRVEEAYVDEQILVREALAIGLQEDPQVQDILAQKMLDVLSADVLQPTEAELEAQYHANRARFASPETATVDELVVETDHSLPTDLQNQLKRGVAPRRLASSLPMRHHVLTQVTLDGLTRTFGGTTAELIFGAVHGAWVGPHVSVRGQHWFRVTERTESVTPALDVIREAVRLDWAREQEQVRLQRRVDELRGRYDVVFTGDETP